MRARDLVALELDQVRNRLADFAASPAGKEACRVLLPSADRSAVSAALQQAWECFRLMEQHGPLPLGEFPDIRVALHSAAHAGFVLDGPALVEIRAVLSATRVVRTFLLKHADAFPALAELPSRLIPLVDLHATLMRALDDHGTVTDDASDELAQVRGELRALRDKVTRRLEELIARPSMGEIIADRYVTVRNNRFVVPIRTATAAQFEGVVQDRSISGETTFVEPLFAVELNNRLLMAAKEEERLVRRILADLTDLVRGEMESLEASFGTLAEIDALAARGRFAMRYRCTQPILDDDEVSLLQARHPMLLFAERTVTPVDIRLPPGTRVLVITGPNTGGKTVALKTLGLLALMAQSGILIPAAEGTRLPCFPGIFADVGDAQSIERNLSTFSAHVANLTDIMAQCEESTSTGPMVLLDEPGVGTDPDEGAAIGVGLIRVLADAGARLAISTHYAAIKVFALSSPICVTAAVDFDLEALAARYQLIYHSVGESLALPIARRLGLSAAVLDAAQAARSEQDRALSAAMERLEDSRRQYETRLADVEERSRATAQAQQEAGRLLAELQEKRRQRWSEDLEAARELVRRVRQQGRDLLAEIERGEADRRKLTHWVREQQTELEARAADQAAQSFTSLPSEPPAAPQIGDLVEVTDTGIRGQLLAVEGARAWIQRGSLRFEVPAGPLRRIDRAHSPHVEVHVAAAPESVPQEISLLGLRTKEALAALEPFLDHAVRARYPSVRIIHGVGSGALRRAVADYLSASPYCSSFRGGEAREGGAGVTIADLATG